MAQVSAAHNTKDIHGVSSVFEILWLWLFRQKKWHDTEPAEKLDGFCAHWLRNSMVQTFVADEFPKI